VRGLYGSRGQLRAAYVLLRSHSGCILPHSRHRSILCVSFSSSVEQSTNRVGSVRTSDVGESD